MLDLVELRFEGERHAHRQRHEGTEGVHVGVTLGGGVNPTLEATIHFLKLLVKRFEVVQFPVRLSTLFMDEILLNQIRTHRAENCLLDRSEGQVRFRQAFEPGENRAAARGHHQSEEAAQAGLGVATFQVRSLGRANFQGDRVIGDYALEGFDDFLRIERGGAMTEFAGAERALGAFVKIEPGPFRLRRRISGAVAWPVGVHLEIQAAAVVELENVFDDHEPSVATARLAERNLVLNFGPVAMAHLFEQEETEKTEGAGKGGNPVLRMSQPTFVW